MRPLRRSLAAIATVWIVALAAGIAVALFVPEDERGGWFALALAGSLVLAFAIQLAGGRSKGFIERVALSVVGAVVALGLVTLVLAAESLLPGI